MKKPTVLLVIGARPQFIKSAPIIKEILIRHRDIELRVVHSGQHYDPEMSEIFFHELDLPKPTLNLQVGSGSHATQTAAIMQRLEREMLRNRPDMVMVPGDTNTTLAGALASAKLNIKLAHVEAGLRSGDFTMPEEVNRKLTDHCCSLLFAPTQRAVQNLRDEGLREQVHFTGDTMVDALRAIMPIVEKSQNATLDSFSATRSNFALVTLHRPSNVDEPGRLRQINFALSKIAEKLPVIFLVHPRTRSQLTRLSILKRSKRKGVNYQSPQGYVTSLALLKNASCLLTDSGGMQKEAFLLGVPCITLRKETEWPETLRGRANALIADPRRLVETVTSIAHDKALRSRISKLRNPFGDGRAAIKIVQIVETNLHQRTAQQ